MKIAINGFGRIGRMVCQAALAQKIEVSAVNDLTDTKTLAHLFQYDSVHGKYKGKVSYDKENVIIDGKKIRVFAEKEPELLPWKKLGIDVAVESTGRFLTAELASKHLKAGAKKVLLSAPGKDASIKTIVMGVNEKDIKKTDLILSNASCTTNSIAPVIKVLHKKFGVVKGLLTTVHSYTADQVLVDGPHSDLRRARAAAINIVPTTTGAAKSVAEAIPELKGKLDGRAIRVPTPCGSITDFTAELKKKTTAEAINKAVKEAAMKELKNLVEYSEEELVSTDIVGNASSAIFDSKLTLVQEGNLAKIFTWYDNEWGYSNRMIDIIKLMK